MNKSTLVLSFLALLCIFTIVQGCGDSNSQTDGDKDIVADGDDEGEQELDAENPDGDLAESTEDDTESDGDVEVGDECTGEEATCSEDGYYLNNCVNGYWVTTNCWETVSGVCKNNECIENWKQHDVSYSACENDPHKDGHTLAEKAAHQDLVTSQVNIHPLHKLVTGMVNLRSDYYEDWATANNKTVETMTDEDYLQAERDATYEDVVTWNTGENDGLWTSMYTVSQVFRYAVTKEQAALDNIKMAFGGTYQQLQITGTPGIFTREYKTPGIEGMSCPGVCSYIPDVNWDGGSPGDKNDNRWIRIKNGCLEHYEADWNGGDCECSSCNGEWVTEETCGLEAFEDYCWLDNVSKDEYSGQMMAASAIAKLIDDDELNTKVTDVYNQVLDHLIRNSMTFIDHDGLECEHGDHWAWSMRGTPGFNALLGLSYFRPGINKTGKQEFVDYYLDCLLKESGPNDCIDQLIEYDDVSYIKYIEENMLLYMGNDGCKSNWNNFSMAMISMFGLIWHENDPTKRERFQWSLENHLIQENNVHDIIKQDNALYNFIYATMRNNKDDFPTDAVNAAICQLQQFPMTLAQREVVNTTEERPENLECESRMAGKYLADTPLQAYQRKATNFVWWSCPYKWDNSTEDHTKIYAGSDYLLTYWMARYFGFISETD